MSGPSPTRGWLRPAPSQATATRWAQPRRTIPREPRMDVHKPKPWHGVREFLKEYAIIVVGVLTALAAESGVEWLHWRHVAGEAEAHLAAGVGPNLVNAVEWLAIEPCFEGRIADLATKLQ